VQFATEAPRDALLESTLPDGLRLRDPATGDELWSASSRAVSTQQIAGMDAAFGASLAAVHLDADGLHDRLYAGDRAGRLWRFDLRRGARVSSWARATLLADLRAPGGGRGFIAAPDVTLVGTADADAWLNIAIGTANAGAQRADHRFYVLRDALAATAPAAPLTEADLALLAPPLGVANGSARGYYLPLGTAQVLAQALTLDGRIYFTAFENPANLLAACASGTLPTTAAPLSVTVLRARDGAVAEQSNGNSGTDHSNLRRALPRPMPASSGVELAATPIAADGRLPCTVDGEALPGCFLDTRPRRSWWRREDAD
jgi:hypothetical protein